MVLVFIIIGLFGGSLLPENWQEKYTFIFPMIAFLAGLLISGQFWVYSDKRIQVERSSS